MARLTCEFSAENLVALVEVLQFIAFYSDKTEQEIEAMERGFNAHYKQLPIKCSFIGAGDADATTMVGVKRTIVADGDGAELDEMKVERLPSLHMAAVALNESSQRDRGFQAIELPPDIPQSSIVFAPETCLKHKVVLLAEKFIAVDAELELNISAAAKQGVLGKLDRLRRLDVDEVLCIFDEVLREVYDLMNGSLARFRLTPVRFTLLCTFSDSALSLTLLDDTQEYRKLMELTQGDRHD